MLRVHYNNLVEFEPQFRLEPFVALGGTLPSHYEVLTVLPDGQDAEEFFNTLQQNPALAIAADKHILQAAFAMMQRTNAGLRASYNVNPSTIFSGGLHSLLQKGIDEGSINPVWLSRQMVEVIEHQLPLGYDAGCLQALKTEFGLPYALDDITRNREGHERIVALGDGAAMFKFHHSILQDIRQGDEHAVLWLNELRSLYPSKTFVVEGFRPRQDAALTPLLKVLGVDAAQVYTPRHEMDDFARESSRMALESGWGALDICS